MKILNRTAYITAVAILLFGRFCFAHGTGPERIATVWPRTVSPANITANDAQAVELGMKFRSYVAGEVVGVMFYKGTANTGTHVGNLWTSSGALLATVTFTDETASGWQAAYFSAPVTIDAHTTYVVSYHTTVGRYSYDSDYFIPTTAGVYSDPLVGLSRDVDGGNGVYKYGASSFPNLSHRNTNYWVDVILAYPDTGILSVVPTSVSVGTGVAGPGTASDLNLDDGSFYQVNSTTAGVRTTSWFATYVSIPESALAIHLTYKGKNSASCTETLSIYNWSTASWTQLNSQSVGATEALRRDLVPPGAVADYVSGTGSFGDVRVRVTCTAAGNFNTSADLLSLSYDPAPAAGVRPVITSPAANQVLSGTTITVHYVINGDPASLGADHIHFILDSNAHVMDWPMDGVYQFTGVPAGSHILRAYLVRADHTYIQGTDATPVSFTTGTSTAVAKPVITAPTAGQNISGSTVNVTYTTTGDLAAAGVDHIHFVLDSNPAVMDSPMDGSYQFTGVAPGSHTLKAFFVRADHTYIQGTDATPVIFTMIVASDTTGPSVSITNPVNGATVLGTITVSANASDNVGVAGVQFLLDGTNLGAEDTTSPYSITWDTTSAAGGSHILTARARDVAGNTVVSTPVNVAVTSTANPSAVGQWSAPVNWPVVGVHIALLHTGEVLAFEGKPGIINNQVNGGVWNPNTGAFMQVPDPATDLFCAGHVQLADGRVLVVGGHGTSHIGIADVNIFNPVTRSWAPTMPMAYRRWYPTATQLADGRVLVTSGADINDRDYVPIPEVFDPVTNTWTSLTGAYLTIPAYPHMFVLPDGKVAYTGTDEAPSEARKLDVTAQVWTMVDPSVVEGGSSVMYDFGKFMKSGTGGDSYVVSSDAAQTTFIIDMNEATPRWQQTAPMMFPRTFHNLTLLPDGNVLGTSGSRRTDKSQPVYEAEMWSPATKTWTTMARGTIPRTYHSSALLLPDARVLVAGSGHLNGMVDQRNYEIYSPGYLFKGARPVLTSAPDTISYATSFFIGTPDASSIASAVLMALGSMTHSANMSQRRVPLAWSPSAGGLTLHAPTTSGLAPPGYYMLFLINTNGVPSLAKFLRLPAPYEDPEPPTAPTNLTAMGNVGTVLLNWTAASDNVGVIKYNVHRSTSSNFTPSVGNRIAQAGTTSYTDSGLGAGRYFYIVTAEDARGNVGPPSNWSAADVLADSMPPTVMITSPANGASVSNVTVIIAAASDNIGITGVQFLLDGQPIGTEVMTAPYSFAWNTASVTNGSHQLAARARDTGGNLTTSGVVNVTVSHVVPSGVVAAYSFNEINGTIVVDSSGNGNHGSVSGASLAAGKYGNGLSFNGSNNMVTVTASPSLNATTGLTISAWVNPISLSSFRVVMTRELPTTDAWALNANDSTDLPGIWARTGTEASPLYGAKGSTKLPLNTWTYLAGTYDGSVLRLYVNGILVRSTNVTGTLVNSQNALRIGGNALWGEWFHGLIDEIRIYNRALSQTEIQTDMNTALAL
jgi:hypothetical protein